MNVGAINNAVIRAFAETVTYTPAAGSPVSIKSIPIEPRPEDDLPATYEIRWVRQADLPAGANLADVVRIGSQDYSVFGIRREHAGGGCKLILAKK